MVTNVKKIILKIYSDNSGGFLLLIKIATNQAIPKVIIIPTISANIPPIFPNPPIV